MFDKGEDVNFPRPDITFGHYRILYLYIFAFINCNQYFGQYSGITPDLYMFQITPNVK